MYSDDGKIYTLTMSNGNKVELPVGEAGSTVSVEIKNGIAVITVGGTPYEIPLGSAVSSLVYTPEYIDGIVELGNDGAKVKFLATPTPEAAALAAATIEFVDIYEAKARTRAGSGDIIVVNGNPALVDGYIEVPIKGIMAQASKTYQAAIAMTIAGTTISSNYFTVQVSGDFSFKAEDINAAIKPKADFSPTANADGSYTVTLDGMDLIGEYKFQDMFEGVPAGSSYGVAAASLQTNGDAQAKQAMLAASMAADGTFEFTERPGTTFGDEGFLMVVKDGYTVIGKTFVKITDPLAAYTIDWSGGLTEETEPEYGARWKGITAAMTELDLQTTFASIGNDGDAANDWEIIHRGREGFFGKFPEFQITAGDHTLVFNNGERLTNGTDEFVSKITTKSDGVHWYVKGICIDVPEKFDLNADGDDNWETDPFVYTKADGNTVNPGGRIRDFGGNNYPEATDGFGWSTKYTWDRVALYGVSMTKDGVLKFSDAYGHHGLRLTIGATFEWFYGSQRLGPNGQQFGYFFFNRRWFEPGTVTFPTGL